MDREQERMEETNFWEPPHVGAQHANLSPDSSSPSIDLVAFAAVFLRRWPFLLMMGLGGFLIALVVAFLLTPQFTSRAVFLPPSQQTAATDNPLALFLRPPSSSIYTGLLTSDSTLTDVITHTNLIALFKARDMEQARQRLKAATDVSSDASGFVTVNVTSKDPALAKKIAESYLDALTRLNDRLAVTEAAQHRLLFQSEFEKAKNDLEKAEVELKKAQEQSGVVSPESQIKSGLSAIDLARADLRARHVALAALLRGQTEQSSEVQRFRSEIATEEAQLAALENGARSAPGSGLSAAEAPSIALRFVLLEREVKYQQVIFDVMARQYETARLQESSAAPGVQVVDYPELPLHKSKPARTLIALAGLALGLLLGLIIVFLRNRLEVLRQDPVRAAALESLRQSITRP